MADQYRQQQFQQWSEAMDSMPSTSNSYYQQQQGGRMTNPNQQRLPNPEMFSGQINPNFTLQQQQQFRMYQDNPFARQGQQFRPQGGQGFPPGISYGQQLGQQQQINPNQYRQQMSQQIPPRLNYPIGRPPLSTMRPEFPQKFESAPGPSTVQPQQQLPPNPYPQQSKPLLPQANQYVNYPTPPPPSQTPQRFEQPSNPIQLQQQPPQQPLRFQQPVQQLYQQPQQQMLGPGKQQMAQLQQKQEQRNAFFGNVAPMTTAPIKTEEYLMDTDINPFQNVQQTNEVDYYKRYLSDGARSNEITGFQEYMRDRKIVPAAFVGARCINPGSGVTKNCPAPYLEFPIEPIDKLNIHAPKENFIRRIKMALKCAQYLPSRDEFDRTIFSPPEDLDELSGSWCHIYYYEFESRVGQTFYGTSSTVTIDGLCAPSNASRFCLGAIGNPNRDPVAVSARRQIGKGWKMILTNGNILLESHSDAAVFVQSPIHAKHQKNHLSTVYRLPGKQSMNVFNYDFFMKTLNEAIKKNQYDGCYALKTLCHMRMSFVKGWGEKYRRQTITYTPCWVEIHLVQMLQAIDDALQNMQAPECDGHSDS